MKVVVNTNKLIGEVDSLIEKYINYIKENNNKVRKENDAIKLRNNKKVVEARKILKEVDIEKIKQDIIVEEDNYIEIPHWSRLFSKTVKYKSRRLCSYKDTPEYLSGLTFDYSSYSSYGYCMTESLFRVELETLSCTNEYPFGGKILEKNLLIKIGVYVERFKELSTQEPPPKLHKIRALAEVAKESNSVKITLEDDDLNTLRYYREMLNV